MKTRADQRLSDKLKKQWGAKFSCYPLLKGHIDGPLFTQPQTEIVNYARELRWRAQATELTTGQTEAGQESMDTQRVRATLKYPQSNEELKLEELPDLDCRVRVTTQDDGSLRLESFVYGAETEPVLSGTTRSGLNLKPCGGTITIRPADDEAIIFVNEVFSSTVDQREVDLSQVFRVPLKEAGTTDCLLGNNQEWELNQIVDYAESVWKGEMRGLVDGKLQQEVLKCATDNLRCGVRSLLLAMSHDAQDTQNTRNTKHTRHTQDTNRELTCHLHAGLGLMSGPTGQAYILPAWKVNIKQKRADEYGSQRCMSEHSAHLSQTLLPLRMTVCVSEKFRQKDDDPWEAILVSKPKGQQANTDPKSSTAIKKQGIFHSCFKYLNPEAGLQVKILMILQEHMPKKQ